MEITEAAATVVGIYCCCCIIPWYGRAQQGALAVSVWLVCRHNMGARLCVCGSVCACACLVRVSRLFVLRVSVGACLSAFVFLCVNKQIIPNTFFFPSLNILGRAQHTHAKASHKSTAVTSHKARHPSRSINRDWVLCAFVRLDGAGLWLTG